METYEVRASDGRTFTMADDDPLHACKRVADLYRVTVVAWRESRAAAIRIGGPIDG